MALNTLHNDLEARVTGVLGEMEGILPLAQRNPRAVSLFSNDLFWLAVTTQQ